MMRKWYLHSGFNQDNMLPAMQLNWRSRFVRDTKSAMEGRRVMLEKTDTCCSRFQSCTSCWCESQKHLEMMWLVFVVFLFFFRQIMLDESPKNLLSLKFFISNYCRKKNRQAQSCSLVIFSFVGQVDKYLFWATERWCRRGSQQPARPCREEMLLSSRCSSLRRTWLFRVGGWWTNRVKVVR